MEELSVSSTIKNKNDSKINIKDKQLKKMLYILIVLLLGSVLVVLTFVLICTILRSTRDEVITVNFLRADGLITLLLLLGIMAIIAAIIFFIKKIDVSSDMYPHF